VRRLLAAFRRGDVSEKHQLRSDRLILRPPRMEDFETWAALRSASRAFLEPWEPLWPADDLTRGAFRHRIARVEAEAEADSGYAFLIFRTSGTLVGGITLSNVRRRAAQMATLGYWMGADHAGKGIMTEAVAMLAIHGFSTLKLQRLEAACIPENIASVRVLEKAGFLREGVARDYLAIAGKRRDHLLFARLARDAAPVIPASSLPQNPA
jgi:ribosomal-protein-alanine N-acetyltransferase